ncbi:MAG: YczE/YyaS/YitT family protein, partial [Acidimicrobiales bacterium]
MSALIALRQRGALRVDPRRAARFIGGLFVASFGMTLMLRTELGAAPWEVFNGGLAALVGVPVGLVRYGVVLAIIAAVALLGSRLGGALVVTGFVGSTWMALWGIVVPQIGTGPLRLAVFTLGLVVMSIGVALYLHAGLGAGPHDALIATAASRTGQTLLIARTMCEVSALVAGALLGGAYGVGTIAFALGLGPLITLATVHLDRWVPIRVDDRRPAGTLGGDTGREPGGGRRHGRADDRGLPGRGPHLPTA